ncbi:NUDIX hydrolase [Catellatospora citrea]|uniref:NUDIX hydrolase n=1 Tax=Catellatospora citrea TaxID=53366 RepID=UPI0033FB15E8
MVEPEINSFATPRLTAGVLFVDAAGRPLLVKPSYKPGWEIPGGYVNVGESPLAACRREIVEELGSSLPVAPQPLVVDWAPAANEGDKVLFIFDGGELSEADLAAMTFPDGEVTEARFVDLCALEDHLPLRLANRMRLALEARLQRRCVYAEHGRQP